MQTAPLQQAIRTAGLVSIPAVSGNPRVRLVGLACVVFTALGWGFNWPATKFLLTTCPPLSARGGAGLVAGAVLFAVAASLGETLAVPRRLWGRLVVAALLNVSAWMGLTTASLLWLPAGQAATLAYSMPVWTALLAWPILNERPVPRQIGAILLGTFGVVILVGGTNFQLDATRLPGVALALSAAVLFALGTVLSKRMPIPLPRVSLTAWQVLLGCIPLLGAGLVFEQAHLAALPLIGWVALAYTALISMGMCYLLWFAAVRRLKTSSASIGTLLTPVIGVAASAVALGDQLTMSQVASLGFVVAGIILVVKDDANISVRPPSSHPRLPPRSRARGGISPSVEAQCPQAVMVGEGLPSTDLVRHRAVADMDELRVAQSVLPSWPGVSPGHLRTDDSERMAGTDARP